MFSHHLALEQSASVDIAPVHGAATTSSSSVATDGARAEAEGTSAAPFYPSFHTPGGSSHEPSSADGSKKSVDMAVQQEGTCSTKANHQQLCHHEFVSAYGTSSSSSGPGSDQDINNSRHSSKRRGDFSSEVFEETTTGVLLGAEGGDVLSRTVVLIKNPAQEHQHPPAHQSFSSSPMQKLFNKRFKTGGSSSSTAPRRSTADVSRDSSRVIKTSTTAARTSVLGSRSSVTRTKTNKNRFCFYDVDEVDNSLSPGKTTSPKPPSSSSSPGKMKLKENYSSSKGSSSGVVAASRSAKVMLNKTPAGIKISRQAQVDRIKQVCSPDYSRTPESGQSRSKTPPPNSTTELQQDERTLSKQRGNKEETETKSKKMNNMGAGDPATSKNKKDFVSPADAPFVDYHAAQLELENYLANLPDEIADHMLLADHNVNAGTVFDKALSNPSILQLDEQMVEEIVVGSSSSKCSSVLSDDLPRREVPVSTPLADQDLPEDQNEDGVVLIASPVKDVEDRTAALAAASGNKMKKGTSAGKGKGKAASAPALGRENLKGETRDATPDYTRKNNNNGGVLLTPGTAAGVWRPSTRNSSTGRDSSPNRKKAALQPAPRVETSEQKAILDVAVQLWEFATGRRSPTARADINNTTTSSSSSSANLFSDELLTRSQLSLTALQEFAELLVKRKCLVSDNNTFTVLYSRDFQHRNVSNELPIGKRVSAGLVRALQHKLLLVKPKSANLDESRQAPKSPTLSEYLQFCVAHKYFERERKPWPVQNLVSYAVIFHRYSEPQLIAFEQNVLASKQLTVTSSDCEPEEEVVANGDFSKNGSYVYKGKPFSSPFLQGLHAKVQVAKQNYSEVRRSWKHTNRRKKSHTEIQNKPRGASVNTGGGEQDVLLEHQVKAPTAAAAEFPLDVLLPCSERDEKQKRASLVKTTAAGAMKSSGPPSSTSILPRAKHKALKMQIATDPRITSVVEYHKEKNNLAEAKAARKSIGTSGGSSGQGSVGASPTSNSRPSSPSNINLSRPGPGPAPPPLTSITSTNTRIRERADSITAANSEALKKFVAVAKQGTSRRGTTTRAGKSNYSSSNYATRLSAPPAPGTSSSNAGGLLLGDSSTTSATSKAENLQRNKSEEPGFTSPFTKARNSPHHETKRSDSKKVVYVVHHPKGRGGITTEKAIEKKRNSAGTTADGPSSMVVQMNPPQAEDLVAHVVDIDPLISATTKIAGPKSRSSSPAGVGGAPPKAAPTAGAKAPSVISSSVAGPSKIGRAATSTTQSLSTILDDRALPKKSGVEIRHSRKVDTKVPRFSHKAVVDSAHAGAQLHHPLHVYKPPPEALFPEIEVELPKQPDVPEVATSTTTKKDDKNYGTSSEESMRINAVNEAKRDRSLILSDSDVAAGDDVDEEEIMGTRTDLLCPDKKPQRDDEKMKQAGGVVEQQTSGSERAGAVERIPMLVDEEIITTGSKRINSPRGQAEPPRPDRDVEPVTVTVLLQQVAEEVEAMKVDEKKNGLAPGLLPDDVLPGISSTTRPPLAKPPELEKDQVRFEGLMRFDEDEVHHDLSSSILTKAEQMEDGAGTTLEGRRSTTTLPGGRVGLLEEQVDAAGNNSPNMINMLPATRIFNTPTEDDDHTITTSVPTRTPSVGPGSRKTYKFMTRANTVARMSIHETIDERIEHGRLRRESHVSGKVEKTLHKRNNSPTRLSRASLEDSEGGAGGDSATSMHESHMNIPFGFAPRPRSSKDNNSSKVSVSSVLSNLGAAPVPSPSTSAQKQAVAVVSTPSPPVQDSKRQKAILPRLRLSKVTGSRGTSLLWRSIPPRKWRVDEVIGFATDVLDSTCAQCLGDNKYDSAQLPVPLIVICHAKYQTHTSLVSAASMTNFGTSNRTKICMQIRHTKAPFLLLLVLLFMQHT
ncbi:unnamed protein product [Amoebophrya sp. A120]|nr:unnamed protein product [Amoebophrya sp. A120]|eukprot:GSA120T00008289001.1